MTKNILCTIMGHERTQKMKTVNKQKASQTPSIKIYFADNGDMRNQIIADAKKNGVSVSVMAAMYLKAGRPLVVKTLDSMNKKAEKMSV